jgi:hypothetical protein
VADSRQEDEWSTCGCCFETRQVKYLYIKDSPLYICSFTRNLVDTFIGYKISDGNGWKWSYLQYSKVNDARLKARQAEVKREAEEESRRDETERRERAATRDLLRSSAGALLDAAPIIASAKVLAMNQPVDTPDNITQSSNDTNDIATIDNNNDDDAKVVFVFVFNYNNFQICKKKKKKSNV